MAKNIQSLERAAAMLRLLAGGERRLGLSDIASSLGLAKATAHGILRTLQAEGFVEQEAVSGRYQLGAELLRLGNSYLDVHELRSRALVWTDDLARSSGESVHVGVLHQGGVLIVHHVFRPDDSRQVLEVGAMQPLHSTALGKVLCAFDPVAHNEALEGERRPLTPRTITLPELFEAELAAVRERGWASDVEETWVGVAAVAAPILDRHGLAVGAIAVTGATERITGPVAVTGGGKRRTPAVKGRMPGGGDGAARAGGGGAGARPTAAGAQRGAGDAGAFAVRADLAASVRDTARAVSRDIGNGRF